MKNTETTATILGALNQLDKLDLDKLYASAIDVALLSYTKDKPDHMERVSIHAEFFGPVKDALRVALRQTIACRRETLARELRDIDITTGLSGG